MFIFEAMGVIQKDAFRTMVISYVGIVLGYINKGFLFLILLTTEEIGLINLLVSIGTLFAQMANLGSIFTIWKFFPFFKNHDKKHHGFLPFMLSIVLFGILVFTLLYVIFQEPIQASYNEKSPLFNDYYYWTLPIGISYVLFLVMESYLRSLYKNLFAVFIYEVGFRFLTTVLLLMLIPNWIDFRTFAIAHSLIYMVPTIGLIVYLYRINELHLKVSSIQISKRFRKIIFQFSSFYYLNTLGNVLVNSLDIMMIAQLVGLKATGVYSTIVFLSSALQVPYKSLLRISSPLISEYWKQREFKKMEELYQKVSSVALVLGLAMFIAVWVNIDLLFSFLKPEFKEGIPVFFALMMGRLIDMYFGLNGAIFTTSKKYKYEIIFTIALIGIVYGLNLLFIPHMGMVGAALSTSIALVVFNFGRLFFIWVTYKIHPFHSNQFKIIGLAVLTLSINHFFAPYFSHLWTRAAVGSGLAFVFFFLPIYWFKLEPELLNYIQKGTRFVTSKFKK